MMVVDICFLFHGRVHTQYSYKRTRITARYTATSMIYNAWISEFAGQGYLSNSANHRSRCPRSPSRCLVCHHSTQLVLIGHKTRWSIFLFMPYLLQSCSLRNRLHGSVFNMGLQYRVVRVDLSARQKKTTSTRNEILIYI